MRWLALNRRAPLESDSNSADFSGRPEPGRIRVFVRAEIHYCHFCDALPYISGYTTHNSTLYESRFPYLPNLFYAQVETYAYG